MQRVDGCEIVWSHLAGDGLILEELFHGILIPQIFLERILPTARLDAGEILKS